MKPGKLTTSTTIRPGDRVRVTRLRNRPELQGVVVSAADSPWRPRRRRLPRTADEWSTYWARQIVLYKIATIDDPSMPLMSSMTKAHRAALRNPEYCGVYSIRVLRSALALSNIQ